MRHRYFVSDAELRRVMNLKGNSPITFQRRICACEILHLRAEVKKLKRSLSMLGVDCPS